MLNAVSTIMAQDRAIRCGVETGTFVYDNRGIILFKECPSFQVIYDII